MNEPDVTDIFSDETLAEALGAALTSAGPMVEQVHRAVYSLRYRWPGILTPTATNLATVIERVRGSMPAAFLEDETLPEHLSLAGDALSELLHYVMDSRPQRLGDNPVEFLQDATITFESITTRLGDILRRVKAC